MTPPFSTAYVRRNQQALNTLAVFEVTLHDLVNISLVDKGVPNCFGVNDRDRPCRATV
jgi:hypothetical protein